MEVSGGAEMEDFEVVEVGMTRAVWVVDQCVRRDSRREDQGAI